MFKNQDELISALFCVEFPQVQNIDFSVKDYIVLLWLVKLINAFCGQSLIEH